MPATHFARLESLKFEVGLLNRLCRVSPFTIWSGKVQPTRADSHGCTVAICFVLPNQSQNTLAFEKQDQLGGKPTRHGTSVALLAGMNATLEHAHDHASIARRVNGNTEHSYLRDFVYGAIDGTVTTFAVVSGVAGAGLNPQIVIVLGLANLLGDGFSMAASNYLGTRTDQQLREKARAMEQRHIKVAPSGEREEVRQIYEAKGFTGEDLDRAVEIITANEQRWIDTMLVDELGLSLEGPSAFKAALTTFVAFCLVGVLPLLAFLFGLAVPTDATLLYTVSAIMTGVAFFLVGAAKSHFVDQKWYWSGAETLAVGGVAAMLAYVVGLLLKGIVGT